MEKYAKLMKGLEMCAGPKCCLDGCPYYGETRGGMTCRARLLADAAITINNESALRESAEEGLRNAVEELGKLNEDLEKAVEGRRSVEAHRDAIESDRADITRERNKLRAENESLRRVNRDLDYQLASVQHDMLKDETDRPSACDKELVEEVGKLIAQANSQEGKADTLEWFLREWFREGGFQS